jgi:hypothetical protein
VLRTEFKVAAWVLWFLSLIIWITATLVK